jgi:hypothetical protein
MDLVPDMGLHITEILDYARDWLAIINGDYFLWAWAAIGLGTMIIIHIIDTVRKPPKLDI